MKPSNAQLTSLLDRPPPDCRLILFHGNDEAAAMAHAARLVRLAGDDAERVDLDAAQLRERPGRLLDEATSPSLFGGKRVIRLLGVDDGASEAIELLLSADTQGDLAVAIGMSLTKRSALVKLVEVAPNAISAPLYIPSGQEADRLATAIARDHGLRLMGDTARRLADAAAGDRAVIAREIEKIALYLDAAPDRPGEVTPATLEAIGADLDDAALFRAIETIVAGRTADVGGELARLAAAGTAPVALMRNLATRLIALAAMRVDVEKGNDPKDVVKSHRVFWKEEAATARLIQAWSAAELARAIDAVRRAERGMMSAASAGDVLAEHTSVAITRNAARRR